MRSSPAAVRAAMRRWAAQDRGAGARATSRSIYLAYDARARAARAGRRRAVRLVAGARRAARGARELGSRRGVLLRVRDLTRSSAMRSRRSRGSSASRSRCRSPTRPGEAALRPVPRLVEELRPLGRARDRAAGRRRATTAGRARRCTISNAGCSSRRRRARSNPGQAIRLLEAGGERAEAELVAAEVLAAPAGCGRPRRSRSCTARRSGGAAGRARASRRYGLPLAIEREMPFAHTALGRGAVALARCALLDGPRPAR